MIDGLPAGSVLVLEIGDKAPFHDRHLEGAPERSGSMTEMLLDGQQRLTALWRALIDDYEDQTYFVDVRNIDEDGDGLRDFAVIGQRRWQKRGSDVRYPVWCDDPKELQSRGLLPLRLLMPTAQGSWKAWMDAAGADADTKLSLWETLSDLQTRVATYNLPFLSLDRGTPEKVVLHVFVKMNTSSEPLTAFDIIVARVEEETGSSLHDLVDALRGQVTHLERYVPAADLVLPAAALLQGRGPMQRDQMFLDFDRMIADWPLLVQGSQDTVAFLESERIPDRDRLPSGVVLAPLVALWARAPESPDARGVVRTLLRRYLWRAFITSRYDQAAASRSQQDFQALLPVVESGQASAPQGELFDLPLPAAEELVSVGWPKRRDRLARAILCASFRSGALDIADGASISAENVGSREYHHLFPVAYLRGKGIDENDSFRALNCALITWRTNRTISGDPPIEYLRKRTEAAALGEDQIRHRLSSHVIDYDQLRGADYEDFLSGRAEAMGAILGQLADGHDWP